MCFLLLFAASFFLSPPSMAQNCGTAYPEWSVANGDVFLNGEPFHIKGASWFGFETEIAVVHGLWAKSAEELMESLNGINLNINAVRIPFSVHMVLNNDNLLTKGCNADSLLCNMRPLDALEILVDELGDRNILVMLDQHRLNNWEISELWYSSDYPESRVYESWDIMMQRFESKWNVFALDLKNEPHGSASWGTGNSATDWNTAAESIIDYIGSTYPDFTGLFFVEGVQENVAGGSTEHSHWYGGNMEGIHLNPINTAFNDRLVYSPHTYGPSVHPQSYFSAADFPDNMPDIWDTHFGFVENLTGKPIVTGEWGGMYTDSDFTWQEMFADYLIGHCMSDNFYWDLNPNSGDTGGLLLDDWSTIDVGKSDLISRVQPDPSWLSFDGTQYCFTPGSRANADCGNESGTTAAPTTAAPTTAAPTTTAPTTAAPTTAAPTTLMTTAAPTTTGGCECVCTTTTTSNQTSTSAPTTTTTTTAPTSTTSTTTTTTSKTTTQTTQSTTTQAPGGGSMGISTDAYNSWGSGDNKRTQVNVILTNNYDAKVCHLEMKFMDMSLAANVVDFYGNMVWTDQANGEFEVKDWFSLEPGASSPDKQLQIVYKGEGVYDVPLFEVINVVFADNNACSV